MENISIKVHPPWYARGTPVTNTRDGPPMALSELSLFAIREGPSARGKPGEYQDRGRGRGQDKGRCRGESRPPANPTTPVWRERNCPAGKSEDRRRGKPEGKTRLWLTLKTTFFNMQNSVYSRRCALLGRKWDVIIDAVRSGAADLSACGAFRFVGKSSDNVRMLADSVTVNAVKSKDVDRIEEEDLSACEEPDNVRMFADTVTVNVVKSKDVDRIEEEDLSACEKPDKVRILGGSVTVNAVKSKDVDRIEDAVRSGEADVDFDLSACEVPDNVELEDNLKMEMEDNVKMEMNEGLVGDFETVDAARSGE